MRRTVDTNVLVRALVDDGTAQSGVAAQCFAHGVIHVPVTVLLEAEWVLRTQFRASRSEIVEHFGMLLGMSNIVLDEPTVIANAVDAHARGFDFADALHLYAAGSSEAFVTFDGAMRRKAGKLAGAVPVIAPI